VFHLRKALALDPRWAEARMALGDVYHHYLPQNGYLREAAAEQFDSALAHGPGFVAPVFHAIQHAFYDENRPRVDSLLRVLRANGPSDEVRQVELMASCLAGRLTATAWRELTQRSVAVAAQAATWMAVGGLTAPQCAIDGLAAVAAADSITGVWRPYALVELATIAAARRDTAAGRRWLGQLGGGLHGSVTTLFLSTAEFDVGGAVSGSAAATIAAAMAEGGARADAVWALAAWLALQGRVEEAGILTDSLERRRPTREGLLYAASLRARLALARGDTLSAIRRLRVLVPTADQRILRWTPWEGLPWERFTLASLVVHRGERDLADQLMDGFDSPASFGLLPWLPRSLSVRAEWAERRGDDGYARVLRRRLERLDASRDTL
jgi:hypothetical protein